MDFQVYNMEYQYIPDRVFCKPVLNQCSKQFAALLLILYEDQRQTYKPSCTACNCNLNFNISFNTTVYISPAKSPWFLPRSIHSSDMFYYIRVVWFSKNGLKPKKKKCKQIFVQAMIIGQFCGNIFESEFNYHTKL